MKSYSFLFVVLLLLITTGCDEDSDNDSTPVVRSEAFTEQFEEQNEICKNRWKEHEENGASLIGIDVFIECNFCECTKSGLKCDKKECTSCKSGEIQEYKCANGLIFPVYNACLEDKWIYNPGELSNEDIVEYCSQCEHSNGNWYSDGTKFAEECRNVLCTKGYFVSDDVKCPQSCTTPGEKKYFECSNGKKVPWCECAEESGRLIFKCTDGVDKDCEKPQPLEGEEYKEKNEICKKLWEGEDWVLGADVFIECNFCKCTKDGLDCENNDCSSCTPGEKRDYKCVSNRFTFPWSECGDDGKWNYNVDNVTADEIKEKCFQCADDQGNWYPDGYEMTDVCNLPSCTRGSFIGNGSLCYPCPEVGQKKDFTCPDGTKVPWCECVDNYDEFSETGWRCVDRADLTCPK